MTPQEFAQASVDRFGFVVVPFNRVPTFGDTTFLVWSHPMPRSFQVIRRATPNEIAAQCDFFAEKVGRRPGTDKDSTGAAGRWFVLKPSSANAPPSEDAQPAGGEQK